MDLETVRAAMIETQVRTNDVTDDLLLSAMRKTPREAFVAEADAELAYAERDVLTSSGRYLWASRDFAKLAQAADIEAGSRILDVAPGSGYSTAIFAAMGGEVTALEAPGEAGESLKQKFAGASNIHVELGDLAAGAPARGPFDVIFVNGAVETAPKAWLDQLADKGRMAVVFGGGVLGRARIYTATGGHTSWRTPFELTVPVLPGFEQPKEFRL